MLLGVDSPPVGVNYCAQLVDAKIDFYPGNVIKFPQELKPTLPAIAFEPLLLRPGLLLAWKQRRQLVRSEISSSDVFHSVGCLFPSI